MEHLSFHYKFVLAENQHKKFSIKLDSKSLRYINDPPGFLPEWTKLDFCKCPNCSLKNGEYCPTAVNMVDLVNFFQNSVSFNKVNLVIETNEREYIKETDLQKSISSLIGIIMVTSGCPVLSKLKPMVKFHLPLSSSLETKYRVISMYLLSQYFLYRSGKTPDWDLKQLEKIYEDIRKVNKHFAERLEKVFIKDALFNAIVILDTYASQILLSIKNKKFEDLEYLFADYLQDT